MKWSVFVAFVLFLRAQQSEAENVASPNSENSGVSVAFCDDFETNGKESFKILAKTVDGRLLSCKQIDPSRGMQRYDLPVLIPQKGVKYIKVVSTSGEDLCLQAVAVDTNIYVDLPTNFKTTCSDEEKTSFPPCKEFKSKLKPLRVCPDKISELLKREQLIDTLPSSDTDARPFEVPKYDAINDYAQAGYVIAKEIADLNSREGVKQYINQLESAMKLTKVFGVEGPLTKINSILGALGPALGIFGGLTSILTTALTPNPFDKLAEYLQEEFTAVHNHLDRMKGELKELIMAEGAMTRMADAVASIRYSLREFQDIAKSLKRNPVCGTNDLILEYSVKRFVSKYKKRDTRHKLLDLLEVELGSLPLTRSLLKPFMKTYCKTKPGKVKRFVTDISTYAFLGTQAQLFFGHLICTMRKPRNCDSETGMWEESLKKLLYKAKALIVALKSPAEGFYQFFKDDLRREVSREVKGESNTEDAKLKRVADLFIYFLSDPENWPKRCIVDSGREVVAYVAVKTNAAVERRKMGFLSPHYLQREDELKLVKMKITNLPQEEDLTHNIDVPYSFDCFNNTAKLQICKVSKKDDYDYPKLNEHPNGKLIYMEINPQNEYLNFSIKPVDVFKSPDIRDPLLLGCWSGKNFLANDGGNYKCPPSYSRRVPHHPLVQSASRFCLFYKNEPNYP